MTPEELGRAVWDKIPVIYEPKNEEDSCRIIGEAILAERERIMLIIVDEQSFLTAEDKRALIDRIRG